MVSTSSAYDSESKILPILTEDDFHPAIQLMQINADEWIEEISRSVEEVSPFYCVRLNNMLDALDLF
jgi:hypothetical protein